jgi:UDP-3-O-[3-hydroxymyristoyl] glucosamine N-acyltransferase
MKKVSISIAELATQIGAKLEDSPKEDLPIVGIASLKRAGAQEVSFFTDGRRYRQDLANTHAAAVILASSHRHFCKVPMLVMENPYLGYARAATLLNPPRPKKNRHTSNSMGESRSVFGFHRIGGSASRH